MKNSRFFGAVLAALTMISLPALAETKPSDLAAPAVKIAPHRAIYKMTLGKVKAGSSISGVSGTMLFDWGDACDGWAVQQHMQLHFIHAEGDETDVSSAVVTWESKDGTRYNFNVRRLNNGEEDESYKGRAEIDAKGEGSARYVLPKDKKDVRITGGTIFPSAHTKLIIDNAMKGEKLFTRRVFDGSDEEGSADVSAFIGPKLEDNQIKPSGEALPKSPLLGSAAWPVRLAFYKPDTQASEPDYEMDLVLQANGVARSMSVDYGDFMVTGTLASIEAGPEIACSDSH